jgi:putative tryptophan/tyrosine transport system substrate-binding protein
MKLQRREFINLIGGMAATLPLAAHAQQANRRRLVGMLMSATESDVDALSGVSTFRQKLEQLGWTEDRNIRIETRWGDADPHRMKTLAKEIVELSPDVLVAYATPAVKALQELTRSIPIVFLTVTDPLGQGLVTSLANPGGNTTGFAVFEFSLGSKWLEALKLIAPGITRVAILFNPETAPYYPLYLRSIEQGALSFRTEPVAVKIREVADFERTIGALAQEPNVGVIVLPDSFNIVHRHRIIETLNRHRLPAIYFFGYFATDGGLIAYGPDEIEIFRRTASYVNRVLRGDYPGDLPVQHPTKFNLLINLKTAKVLGFVVPPILLANADEVIE